MTHAPLTEDSVSHSLRTPIGKGREGKGIGREGKFSNYSSIHRYCPNTRDGIGWMP